MTKRRSDRSNLLIRLLEAAQRRFRSARPGSVLIMVVALLVLLALIGTAAMSTARIDRMSSKQHVTNTQIEMLADSVKQMVIGQLVNDLFPPNGGTNETDAVITDPDLQYEDTKDVILASRLPERFMKFDKSLTPKGTPTFATNSDPIIWRFPSYLPLLDPTSSKYQCDLPIPMPNGRTSFTLPLSKFMVQPLYVAGETLPKFQVINPDGSLFGQPFLAADTDGDGVPDSLYFKLPVSPVDGVTYYASLRVLDNASALNLNTAWDATKEFADVKTRAGTQTVHFTGIFPGSADLFGAIASSDQTNFNNLRITGDVFNTAPVYDPQQKQPLPTPVADDWTKPPPGTPRNDFYWLTPGDFLHHQLGRRLSYPGFYTTNDYIGGGIRPFGVDATLVLANRFTIFDPSAADSTLEQALKASIATNSSTPYPNSQTGIDAWFKENFDYAFNGPQNVKALLTSINPVRNYVTRNKYLYIDPNTMIQDPTDATKKVPKLDDPYQFLGRANINTATFEELHQNFYDVMADADDTTPFDDNIGYSQSQGNPYYGMGFNPNTHANIPEDHPARMFRSPIRNVTDQSNPFTLHPNQVMYLRAAIAAANVMSMRSGAGFNDPPVEYHPSKDNADAVVLPPVPASVATGNEPIYRVHVYGMRPQPFITEVYLSNNVENEPGSSGANAKRNPRGFAAIELHNPYSDDLVLKGWRLKIIDRDSNFGEGYTLDSVPLMNNTADTGKLGAAVDPPTAMDVYVNAARANAGNAKKNEFSLDVTIPAGGYLVIWNYSPTLVKFNGDDDPDTAQYLPDKIQAPAANVIYLKTLNEMIGKELVLMRPDQNGVYVPVDSYDASGLERREYVPPGNANGNGNGNPNGNGNGGGNAGGTGKQPENWHYVRANDPTAGTNGFSRAWNFVYPGRYNAGVIPNTTSRVSRRHQGTDTTGTYDPDPANSGDPWLKGKGAKQTPINLGVADAWNSREGRVAPGPSATLPLTSSFAIPFANTDMFRSPTQNVSPFEVTNKPAFPFNGFARVGDVMQAPFIGSYWIEAQGNPTGVDGSPKYTEVTPVTMDAAFAEDTDVNDDADISSGLQLEEVGRLAPFRGDLEAKKVEGIVQSVKSVQGKPDVIIDPFRPEPDDFWTPPNNVTTGLPTALVPYEVTVYEKTPGNTWKRQTHQIRDYKKGRITIEDKFVPALAGGERYVIKYVRYAFAAKIFDYFTTLDAPGDDYLPNRDPNIGYKPDPVPVKNVSDPLRSVNRQAYTSKVLPTEDGMPIEGLININTANWRILAALPLVVDKNTGQPDWVSTAMLAQRIVYYRDVDDGFRSDPNGAPDQPHPHGPFRNIFELNLIKEFATMQDKSGRPNIPLLDPDPAKDPDINVGDYSILADTSTKFANSKVRCDFTEKFLNVTRLSNLLTTRSDAYTAYVMVQGWRDAGTPQATLVAVRRLAFIVDRSAVTKTNKVPKVYNVPTAN